MITIWLSEISEQEAGLPLSSHMCVSIHHMETMFNGKILPEYGYFIYWQTIRSLVIDEDNGGNAKTKTGALAVFLWKIA